MMYMNEQLIFYYGMTQSLRLHQLIYDKFSPSNQPPLRQVQLRLPSLHGLHWTPWVHVLTKLTSISCSCHSPCIGFLEIFNGNVNKILNFSKFCRNSRKTFPQTSKLLSRKLSAILIIYHEISHILEEYSTIFLK